MSILICPVCSSSLAKENSVWSCGNGHSFDVAKEGYVNLLLANQKASKLPGDSPEMLKARRQFLSDSHYEKIAKELAGVVAQLKPSLPDGESVYLVDSGCGEGYYLDYLQRNLNGSFKLTGLDIAKEGVRLAAKKHSKISWVCGSSAHLPFADKSVDFLLRVFAPGDGEGVWRCLKDEGCLIVISPAANHLRELKNILYDEVRLHTEPKDIPNFSLCSRNQVEYVLSLRGTSVIKNLLSMTPFFWQGSFAGKNKLLSLEELTVTAHVFISVYKKI